MQKNNVPFGRLEIETTKDMVLAHWELSTGEKVGLGVLSSVAYSDPVQHRLFRRSMYEIADRILQERAWNNSQKEAR